MLADWQKLSAPLKQRNKGHLNGLYIPFEGISERFRISHMGAIETRNTYLSLHKKNEKKRQVYLIGMGAQGAYVLIFLA
jgi:hypothetical protein